MPDFSPAVVSVVSSSIKQQSIEWLWPGKIPKGKLTLIFGDPGLGKSLVTIDMAARVSRGRPWPDELQANVGKPSSLLSGRPAGSVLMLSAEDDAADTICPRLSAAGADMDRVRIVEGVLSGGGASVGHLNLGTDLRLLWKHIEEIGGCDLLIIDPVSAYLGSVDTHKNSDVRGLLSPLAAIAARARTAVVLVTHLNKSAGSRALYRATGSLAFVAAARAAWLIAEDTEDRRRRLMLPAKMNLAPDSKGRGFAIMEGENGQPCIAWEMKEVEMRADDVLGSAEVRATQQKLAEAWLATILADGPKPVKEILEAAQSEGICSEMTLRRAREALGVKAVRKGFGDTGGWWWSLGTEEEGDGGCGGVGGSGGGGGGW